MTIETGPEVPSASSDEIEPAKKSPAALTQLALTQLALERTGVVAAALGFALLAVKVTRASHLNPRTSHALMTTAGPIEVILGSLITHLPMILFVLSALMLWWAVGSFSVLRSVTSGHTAVAGVLLFALLLLPWPFVAALVGIGWFRFLRAPGAQAMDQTVEARRKRRSYYVLAIAAAIVLIVDSDMWLPPEEFQLTDGAAIVGYALEEDEDWIAILIESDREVVHVHQAEIAARDACRFHEEDLELESFPSLLQIAINENTDLPEPLCPE